MNVTIDERGGERTWDHEQIERLALFALERMEVPDACEVSISLVGPEEIQRLNAEYRGIDKPTDVLSFECDDPWAQDADDDLIEIGDVVIALDVVDEQRERFGTTFEQEASLMLVHSLLHLLGYDHMDDAEAEEMEAIEREILEAYGIEGVR